MSFNSIRSFIRKTSLYEPLIKPTLDNYYRFYKSADKKNIIAHKIKGVFRKLKPAFISAYSRSGTWYNREFFYFYNQLLNGKSASTILDHMIAKKLKIKPEIRTNYKKTGYDAFLISHWSCPGFDEYNGKYRDAWDKLIFYADKTVPSDPGHLFKKYHVSHFCNPVHNKNARLVYYYRNPLDHAVAYLRAITNSLLSFLKYRIDSNGNKILIKDVHDYLRTVGIDMYLKHVLSFKFMKELYPDNILILTYEDMTRNPRNNFLNVLKFLGHDVHLLNHLEEFNKAIELSSKESIIKLENAYGESIAKNYTNKNNRQLHDGKIGKWKGILNNNDLKYIETRFNEFNLSLNEFTID